MNYLHPNISQYLHPFLAINRISTPINDSNFTPVFFKADCHAHPELKEVLQDVNDKFFEVFPKFLKIPTKSNVSLLR